MNKRKKDTHRVPVKTKFVSFLLRKKETFKFLGVVGHPSSIHPILVCLAFSYSDDACVLSKRAIVKIMVFSKTFEWKNHNGLLSGKYILCVSVIAIFGSSSPIRLGVLKERSKYIK